MQMERIESSETSALKAQAPGDYPKDTVRCVQCVTVSSLHTFVCSGEGETEVNVGGKRTV